MGFRRDSSGRGPGFADSHSTEGETGRPRECKLALELLQLENTTDRGRGQLLFLFSEVDLIPLTEASLTSAVWWLFPLGHPQSAGLGCDLLSPSFKGGLRDGRMQPQLTEGAAVGFTTCTFSRLPCPSSALRRTALYPGVCA